MSEPRIDCDRCRQAVSALLDQEDAGCPSAMLHAHLAECADCRSFETEATRLHRAVRVSAAPAVPDLSPQILRATETVEPASNHLDAWRAALAVVALIQIALAVPALLFGSDAGLPVHTARHLGSFDVALAVGFLFVAWKPSRVPGLIPVALALVACLFLTSVIDVANGRTGALSELGHMTELLGLALCVMIGRAASPHQSTFRQLLGRPA